MRRLPVPQAEVTVKTAIRLALVLTLLVIANSAFAAQVSIGIHIGPPPPPPVMAVVPVTPGPEFVWVGGYWYPIAGHWRWHSGYWTRAPYAYAQWVTPRYERGVYVAGYWQGEHGRIEHDHHWDKAKERDFHGRGKAKGRGR